MADLFGTHLDVEVKIDKLTGKYTVTILDHGEQVSCTAIDENGENINAKIVKYIAEQIGGSSGEPELTKKGEMVHRQASVTFNPLENDEEEEEDGYNPLDDSPMAVDPYDAGGFGI